MMRNKKIIKILIIIIIPVIYFGLFFIQNYSLQNSFAKEENAKFGEDTKFIRCNYNILKPEFAFTFETGDGGRIGFYRSKNFFYQTEQEWDNNEIGGTTIYNTTFDELVKMVKKDCSQFQKAYYDESELGYTDDMTDEEKTERWHQTELKNINWSYSPARTQEQLDEDEIDRLMREYSYLVPEAQLVFDEVYGDPYKMTNEELLELKKEIDEKGMDERVYIKDKVTIFHNGYPKLTDRQKRIILDTYGEWENLTDKELADYSARITEDHQSGKLVLE